MENKPAKAEGGALKKISTWIFAIIGLIIVKTVVDMSYHPNRQERMDRVVENAINEGALKSKDQYNLEDKNEPPSEMAQVLTTVIQQMKMVILNNDTPASIEEKISKSIEMGATAVRLDRYSNNKIGWSLMNSKDRKVYSIIITIKSNSRSIAEYLTMLMSKEDITAVFDWHQKIMNENYTLDSPNNFNIGDGCIAILSTLNSNFDSSSVTVNVSCR